MPDASPTRSAADVDVAVVGAGVAGLSAAAALRNAGLRCVVLEASDRIGGRAWTDAPAFLEAPFERGAVWLHDAARNPLVEIARAAGDGLDDAELLRSRHTFVGPRPVTEAERAAYHAAWDEFEQAALALMGPDRRDMPLAAVARSLPDHPWALTIEGWEGPVIATADAADLSLIDWHRNLLEGANLLVRGGLGTFVARRLGPMAEKIRTGTAVSAVNWDAAGGRVLITTSAGTISAAACIVTVSLGVLASGAIRFSPRLPAAIEQCLHGLPMGLAMKIALRARGPDRLDLPPFSSIDRQRTGADQPAVVWSAWPHGRDHISAWVGGGTAWALSREGSAAAEDFARRSLREIFGERVDAALRPGAFATSWGTDPHYLGAYAYARPGYADLRAQLAEPQADGRLLFAGEAAVSDGLAGTVAGAWNSGRQAADLLIPKLKANGL